MSAAKWSIRLCWILEALAFNALAWTHEVRIEVFGLVGVLLLLSRVLRRREGEARVPMISERTVMTVMAILVFSGVAVYFKYRFHPIVIASYLAPVLHSMLWFAPETGRYRGWRIGVGFVQLVLASALAPEAYLFPAIFTFALLGSVAVSCGFLDEELRSRAPDLRYQPLPRGFVARSFALAFLIFLTSVVIFPILPRVNSESRGGQDGIKVGYTENVELGTRGPLNGKEGTGEPLLRLYALNGDDLTMEFYLGLIRGRSLDVFDGAHWAPSPRRAQVNGVRFVKPIELREAIWVDAVRGSMPTSSLPVPYGAIQVASGSGYDDAPYPRTMGGAWVDPSSVNSSVHYSFGFIPYQKALLRRSGEEDPPVAADLSVPSILKNERMERLANSIFGNANTEADKVNRLAGFFVRERFSASFEESLFRTAAVERMHPIERFLLVTKEGHCEYFASAATILLRMSKVPARLVAGFRIATGAVGGVVTLTTNDAHAWVEYWSPSKGWLALDPTPRLLRPPSFLNWFRDGYDFVSAYWYRYVLNFAEKGKSRDGLESVDRAISKPNRFRILRNRFQGFVNEHKGLALALIVFAVVFSTAVYQLIRWKFPWILSIRYRVREGSPALRTERIRMERLIFSRLKQSSVADALAELERTEQRDLAEALLEWQRAYESLRFGRLRDTEAKANWSLMLRMKKKVAVTKP